ncbi:hypothetical protein B0H67DRAFT_650326 [Lasiosphaeris hirsuta]|uniref:Uncharacterized protein n=1 Tax=Lasiosphaeris hirsuta TaxID=260670 RepID=A0AA39ZRQ1_9PEZI|nr:hypothetical protein B0H67DRAFT_650326 [Lasiosphaeris hirsuta]
MDFRMDIDMNPRKRFRDDEPTLDAEEGPATKKTRQSPETETHMQSDAFAFARDPMSISMSDSIFDPPSPSDSAPSPPASISDDENTSSFQQPTLPQPQSTIISALNHTRRNQHYIGQGYPLSWLYSTSHVSAPYSYIHSYFRRWY